MRWRALAILVLAACTPGAWGLIRADFTPRHLAAQADVILAGRLKEVAGGAGWSLAVARRIKGQAPDAHLLRMAACNADHLEEVGRALKAVGDGEAILVAAARAQEAYVHAAGVWLAVRPAEAGRWDVLGLAPRMSGTYAGGTDMLIRMMEHLLADPRADVPVRAGVGWLGRVRVGQVAGQPAGLAAVELGRPPRAHLLVASEAGDRLLRAAGKDDQVAFEDVTAAARLDTKSLWFAWIDANADGLGDLVSAGPRGVCLRWGAADGTFRPAGGGWTFQPPEEPAGLAACPRGESPGVLLSTRSLPVHLVAAAGGWRAERLPRGPAMDKLAGSPSACIVADFDGDGFADVLQPSPQGGLLWRGKADGFHPPAACPVAAEPPARAAVADFDADGSPDVFLASPGGCSLWSNDGRGGFVETLALSGSLGYKCPPGPQDVLAADLNHDGWLDLCLIYRPGALLYHFNRGFRCFGEEGEVRLEELQAASEQGGPDLLWQAAGDFNGDGSQDLAVMCTDGTVWCYLNEITGRPILRLRLGEGVAAPVMARWAMDGRTGGPITATAVHSASPPGAVAIPRPGRVSVRYRLPGRPEQVLRIIAGPGATEVVLRGEPARE